MLFSNTGVSVLKMYKLVFWYGIWDTRQNYVYLQIKPGSSIVNRIENVHFGLTGVTPQGKIFVLTCCSSQRRCKVQVILNCFCYNGSYVKPQVGERSNWEGKQSCQQHWFYHNFALNMIIPNVHYVSTHFL